MLFQAALVQESNFFTIQGQDKFDQKVLNDITASPSDTNGLSFETSWYVSLSKTFLLFKGIQRYQSHCFNSFIHHHIG